MARKHRKGVRSPNYPGLTLEDAHERAKVLYEKENRSETTVQVVLKHWGYSDKSGPGLVALAALKAFGFVDIEGASDARKVRLSEDGLAIVQDKRTASPERDKLLMRAALRPTIHTDLWNEFGGAPTCSDETLRHKLVTERGFTERAVGRFMELYRATLEYANLDESGSMGEDQEDGWCDDEPSSDDAPCDPPRTRLPKPSKEPGVPPIDLSLPLTGKSEPFVVRGPGDATKKDFERLIRVLESMTPETDESKEEG